MPDGSEPRRPLARGLALFKASCRWRRETRYGNQVDRPSITSYRYAPPGSRRQGGYETRDFRAALTPSLLQGVDQRHEGGGIAPESAEASDGIVAHLAVLIPQSPDQRLQALGSPARPAPPPSRRAAPGGGGAGVGPAAVGADVGGHALVARSSRARNRRRLGGAEWSQILIHE